MTRPTTGEAVAAGIDWTSSSGARRSESEWRNVEKAWEWPNATANGKYANSRIDPPDGVSQEWGMDFIVDGVTNCRMGAPSEWVLLKREQFGAHSDFSLDSAW